MLDCRYYDLCGFTDDSCNGEPECPKRDHCQFYSPMPDVKALTGLAEDVTYSAEVATAVDASKGAEMLAEMLLDIARRIREACGEVIR